MRMLTSTRQMILSLRVALVVAGLAPVAYAQEMRVVKAWNGAVSFSVPVSWHVLREETRDSSAAFVYHVRNPASDSGTERTNVMVLPRIVKAGGDFRQASDSAFRTVSDRSMIVLNDVMPKPDRRAIFWRGEANGILYIGFDNYARAGTYWVYLRIAHPLVEGSSAEWRDAFYRHAEAIVRSVTIHGRKVMDDGTGFPAVMSAP